MKKTIALMIAMALCFLLAACGSGEEPGVTPDPAVSTLPGSEPAAESLEIAFAIPGSLTALESDSLDAWMALVTEHSGGNIVINCTRESELTGAALLEETKNGARDMAVTSTEELRAAIPEAVLLQLPFVFESYAHAAAFFGGEPGGRLTEEFGGESGVRMLNTLFGGFRYILSDMPLSTPEDCRGLLIRAPRVDVFTDMLGIMEFSYIAMDWDEAYGAMSGGVITAVEGTLFELSDQRFYELGSNVLCTRHMLNMSHVVVNEAWWSALTDEQRAILTDTLAEVAAEQWNDSWAEEKLAQSELEAEGVAFAELEKSAKKDLQKTFEDYWQAELEDFDKTAADILDEILDLT